MIKINAERDSVCMGDDVMAPNADHFFFEANRTTEDLLLTLCGYVPRMKSVVWEVLCSGETIGYLFSDETGLYRYETAGPCRYISELPSHLIFCKYYYTVRDYFGDPFSKDMTLLEKVKAKRRKKGEVQEWQRKS